VSFTAGEIESRRFVKAFRGYDPEEVDAFLRAVAEDLRIGSSAPVRAQGRAELPLLPALVIALVAAARAEADAVLAEAHREAEQVQAAAHRRAQAIVVHARHLRAQLLAAAADPADASAQAEAAELARAWWQRADGQLDAAIDHLAELQETLLSVRDGLEPPAAPPPYPPEELAAPVLPLPR
jgi:DivIVA domain-containing protein